MKTLFKAVKAVTAFLSLSALGYLIYKGYDQPWTGLQGYTNNKGEFVPPKKLWDWLQLLIIPILLSVGIWWLNKSQKKSEQQIETDRQRQKALEDYFAGMTDLLLKKKLRSSSNTDESRNVARTRTLAVLRILDGGRKAQAIQFLYESGLISKNPIVQLNGADLRDARFTGATLRASEMRGVYFNNAHFKGANLRDADMRGYDFSQADLTEAYMNNANLAQATLEKAKLSKANLTGAITVDANFGGVDKKGAKMPVAQANTTKGD